jgi:hypothetical protein
MANTRDLINRAAREIEASRTTSTTPPGPTSEPRSPEHVEAINQVFALFRLNYHNQYYAAYPDAEQVIQIKKLWLDSLGDYPVEQILRGARHAIENSEYLPTLHRMHECCVAGLSEFGLPSAHDAYVEACQRPSPKSAQPWSHAAVYLAGRDADWFFLANHTEREAYPVFSEHYQRWCAAVLRGEELEVPNPAALEQSASEPLSREEQLSQLQKLKQDTGLGS